VARFGVLRRVPRECRTLKRRRSVMSSPPRRRRNEAPHLLAVVGVDRLHVARPSVEHVVRKSAEDLCDSLARKHESTPSLETDRDHIGEPVRIDSRNATWSAAEAERNGPTCRRGAD